MLSACKLPGTLVGLTVDDPLGGFVVVDCLPVFPKFMNNVFTVITVISGISIEYSYCAFCMQVTRYTSWFDRR